MLRFMFRACVNTSSACTRMRRPLQVYFTVYDRMKTQLTKRAGGTYRGRGAACCGNRPGLQGLGRWWCEERAVRALF